MLKNVQSQHSFLKKKPARGGQILEYFIFSVLQAIRDNDNAV